MAAVPVIVLNTPGLVAQRWSEITLLGWASMAWAIVIPVLAAWSIWNWVHQELTSGEVAPLLFLVPVISGLTAWLVLDETITRGQILGSGLVVLALWLNHTAAPRIPTPSAGSSIPST